MSMQQTPQAALRGFRGPLYPSTISAMARAFTAQDVKGMGGLQLEVAAKECAGFMSITPRVVTGDGYSWSRMISFRANDGRVLIAFPMAKDAQAADGTFLDRSPAVYTTGLVDIRGAETVVTELARAMRTVRTG